MMVAMSLFCFRSIVVLLLLSAPVLAEEPPASAPASEPADKGGLSAETLAGLKFRCIGPAFTSGRVADFAVHPQNRSTYYVAVASGGVWKTTNAGVTYAPIFDAQGSYSIGCLALDPKNPNVIWVGTGENNSQRSVAFGDGVYRSRDGGKNWENLGLRESEHIGMISIDPRDSDVVYVAAQGPLWRSGPERGLYKTTDGGKSWRKILDISADTGVNEIHIHPADPDTLFATAYQRRRHVWTLIDGGPESALYKSGDGGETWRKITAGLPNVDLGRIGLDIAPGNPDIVYAIVEAAEGKSGTYRSSDRGETWDKRSDYVSSSPQYYNEFVCDPADADHVYSLDTWLMETLDGGKTFRRVRNTNRHVDDHALWIDPKDPAYMLIGCDGGIYESFDRGENWRHMHHLPVTQFYRVTVDNSAPFYYVYGGTQDNNTVGGPSRTTDRIGIANEHWFVTCGGDGFETQVDPEDPNIVYSQSQNGGLVRFDRRSGEGVDIRPREKPGDAGLRWNWDSPLIISPHNRKRLYFASNILYRSEDQGGGWTAVSPDLTRQLDRNQLLVMGRIQNVDAVAKSNSTSFYGNCVSLCESPVVEGLIYVGTDDGLVQVTEDGGTNWRKIDTFPGVPLMTYVSCLRASRHAPDTVYASFDNHKNGDFKPYLLKSADRGKTWTSVAGNLPPRDTVYSIAEDHVSESLLFVGTEFGVYCTVDGGEKWHKLKGGLPTIAVRDIDIQARENDLALATFGRGFYILDDYSPLRQLSPEKLKEDAALMPVKDALAYIEANRLGSPNGKGWMGASYYAAANPPFGATITYYLKEKLQSRKEKRKEEEKKAAKEGRTPPYPTLDELRAEDQEREPQIVLTVRDVKGAVVRRLTAPREKGVQRMTWNLRYPAPNPTSLAPPPELDPWDRGPDGPPAIPGEYSVTLSKEVDGVVTDLAPPQKFKVVPLELATFAAKDKEARLAFNAKVSRLQRAAMGASRTADEAQTRIASLRKGLLDTPGADPAILKDLESLQQRMNGLLLALRGDSTRARRNEPQPPSISDRIGSVAGDQWYVSSPPTQTQVDDYKFAAEAFEKCLGELRALVETDLKKIEERMEQAGAPWTPGRLPTWKKE
ncbi:Dispase autolysis-inducing protein precursor [Phycisphaerae bacterium RAS1]|nr:Dispase autolysis-inducing protein precursor [Phycisphaerae bacterium RAS1]